MRVRPFPDHLHHPQTQEALRIAEVALKAVHAQSLFSIAIKREGNRLVVRDIQGRRFSYDLDRYRRIFLLGAGKASAAMAKALLDLIPADRIHAGLIITKTHHAMSLGPAVRCLEAEHPIPGERTLRATQALLQLADEAGRGDLVLFCLSGGASALLELPKPGVSLDDIQRETDKLLHSQTSIGEINHVRTSLSQIKGGGLAQRIHPAKWVTLVISDVIGDDPQAIGSGPTVSPNASENDYHIVGNITSLMDAARQAASVNLDRQIYVETPFQGSLKDYADWWMKQIQVHAHEKCAVISGSECCLEIPKGVHGKGGRNQHLALQFLEQLAFQAKPWSFVSLGTDGTDGSSEATGVVINHLTRENSRGINIKKYLSEFNSDGYFEQAGGQLLTGPTGTNVNDLQLLLIG